MLTVSLSSAKALISDLAARERSVFDYRARGVDQYEQAIQIANLAGHAPAERLHRIGAAQAATARGRRKD
jgi:hypothetical protein